jgi:acyl-coenzyme A thioesterase PaaI-like protein
MSQLLAELRAARERGDPGPLIAAVPYARFLGFSVVAREGEMLGVMRYSDALIGNPMLPALHGGTLCALLESTAIFEICWGVALVGLPKTITMTVDYLRSGRPVDTFAKGRICRQGRRVVNVHVEAWQEDRTRPIAAALGHFLLPSGEP